MRVCRMRLRDGTAGAGDDRGASQRARLHASLPAARTHGLPAGPAGPQDAVRAQRIARDLAP